MMMARKPRTRGTDNVLADLGFDDAEELSVKAMLAMKLNALLETQGLTQAGASKILGMPQPKISAIRNYKLRGISLERLMQALTILGQHVRIVVTPKTADPLSHGEKDTGGDEGRVLILDGVDVPLVIHDVDEQ